VAVLLRVCHPPASVLYAGPAWRVGRAWRADADTANPKPCAEKKKKTTTSGPGDTILNPTTGRFVLRSGAIGTKILLAKAERVLNGLADSESESESGVASSSEGESESESAGAPSRKKQKCENVNLLPELLSKKPKPVRDARFREVEVSEKSPYGKIEKKKRVKKLWQRAMQSVRAVARFKLAAARQAASHTGMTLEFDEMDIVYTNDISGSSASKAKHSPPAAHKPALRHLPARVGKNHRSAEESKKASKRSSLKSVAEDSYGSD
jgi:hypothetical protein